MVCKGNWACDNIQCSLCSLRRQQRVRQSPFWLTYHYPQRCNINFFSAPEHPGLRFKQTITNINRSLSKYSFEACRPNPSFRPARRFQSIDDEGLSHLEFISQLADPYETDNGNEKVPKFSIRCFDAKAPPQAVGRFPQNHRGKNGPPTSNQWTLQSQGTYTSHRGFGNHKDEVFYSTVKVDGSSAGSSIKSISTDIRPYSYPPSYAMYAPKKNTIRFAVPFDAKQHLEIKATCYGTQLYGLKVSFKPKNLDYDKYFDQFPYGLTQPASTEQTKPEENDSKKTELRRDHSCSLCTPASPVAVPSFSSSSSSSSASSSSSSTPLPQFTEKQFKNPFSNSNATPRDSAPFFSPPAELKPEILDPTDIHFADPNTKYPTPAFITQGSNSRTNRIKPTVPHGIDVPAASLYAALDDLPDILKPSASLFVSNFFPLIPLKNYFIKNELENFGIMQCFSDDLLIFLDNKSIIHHHLSPNAYSNLDIGFTALIEDRSLRPLVAGKFKIYTNSKIDKLDLEVFNIDTFSTPDNRPTHFFVPHMPKGSKFKVNQLERQLDPALSIGIRRYPVIRQTPLNLNKKRYTSLIENLDEALSNQKVKNCLHYLVYKRHLLFNPDLKIKEKKTEKKSTAAA